MTTTALAKPMVPAALQTAGFTAVGGRIYPINATAADVPVVLPAAAAQGVVLTFTRADISTHSVSIAASGSETILKGTGSFSSVVLNGGQGHTMTFVSAGGGAWRLATEVPGIATYSPLSMGRPGNRWVALGDSLTAGGVDNTANTPVLGEAWPVYASIMSQQRLHLVRDAGIAGNKSSDMLARFDTDVTPYAPSLVTILAGTNDYSNAVSMATWQANIKALVAKCVAIGAKPVLATMPPRDAGGYQVTIAKWNAWLRQYAETNSLALLDFYRAVIDPSNGHYLSGYFSDGIHPNVAGQAMWGEITAAALAGLTPGNAPFLPADNTDTTNNLLVNPLFITDANSDGIADSWVPGSSPTGVVKSLVTDSVVLGKMQQFACTSASGLMVLQQVVSSGFAVGDVLRATGVVTMDGGTSVAVHVTFTGGSANSKPMSLSQAISRGVFCHDIAVPTGTTSITFGLEVGTGSGFTSTVAFGQCALFNLTAMGTLS